MESYYLTVVIKLPHFATTSQGAFESQFEFRG
jgi:hypothetical protein